MVLGLRPFLASIDARGKSAGVCAFNALVQALGQEQWLYPSSPRLQSTLPARGSDKALYVVKEYTEAFQSTLPARGATGYDL